MLSQRVTPLLCQQEDDYFNVNTVTGDRKYILGEEYIKETDM